MPTTLLPYPDYIRSAAVLDDALLFDQKLVISKVLETLLFRSERDDPTAEMWEGYEVSLFYFQLAVTSEYRIRGYDDDTALQRTCAVMVEGGLAQYVTRGSLEPKLIVAVPAPTDPPWLGDGQLHDSHQAFLVRCWPQRYRPTFSGVDADTPLYWP